MGLRRIRRGMAYRQRVPQWGWSRRRHPRPNHTSGEKSPALQSILCLKLPPHDFPMHSASTPTAAEGGPATPTGIDRSGSKAKERSDQQSVWPSDNTELQFAWYTNYGVVRSSRTSPRHPLTAGARDGCGGVPPLLSHPICGNHGWKGRAGAI